MDLLRNLSSYNRLQLKIKKLIARWFIYNSIELHLRICKNPLLVELDRLRPANRIRSIGHAKAITNLQFSIKPLMPSATRTTISQTPKRDKTGTPRLGERLF